MKGMSEFTGCEWIISVPKKTDIVEDIKALMECGHEHNFMVALGGLRLYVSMTGMECISGRRRHPSTGRPESLATEEKVAGSNVDSTDS